MPKFRVYGIVTGSKYLGEFEADDEQSAEIAAANSPQNSYGLCHQCSDEFDLDEHSCQSFVVEKTE
jgi:hypothetical protein